VSLLAQRGIGIAVLRPIPTAGSTSRGALTSAIASSASRSSPYANFRRCTQTGECVITSNGIEGGLIYALSADLRDEMKRSGSALVSRPAPRLDAQRAPYDESCVIRAVRASLSSHLQSRLEIKRCEGQPAARNAGAQDFSNTALLATRDQSPAAPTPSPGPLSEAISSAGA